MTTSQYYKTLCESRDIVDGVMQDAVSSVTRADTQVSLDPLVSFFRPGFFKYAQTTTGRDDITSKELLDVFQNDIQQVKVFLDAAQRSLDSRTTMQDTTR